MKIFYRISDGGNVKNKPSYVHNKQLMFLHFINIFRDHDIYVFADNVCDETYNFLIDHYDSSKITKISLGNSKSFMFTVDYAIANFSEDEKVYFAEDDYIYKKIAPKIIEEGLDIADFSSGYDHPDKYINGKDGGNPFIEEGGELTRVLVTQNTHWKLTNSCCMTFATRVHIVRDYYEQFKDACNGICPNDFGLFCILIQQKNKKLVSSIPAVSTHGENQWMSKFIDWEKTFYDSLTMNE